MQAESRGRNVINNILDNSVTELENASSDIIRMVISDIKDWLINKYNSHKTNSVENEKITLVELEKLVRISDENVEIGMRKKEIAIMWAMKKLGYSEKDTQAVLNLANEAYCPKEQINQKGDS